MKDLITLALAATIVTGVTASPNHHQHLHRHARRHQLGSPLEKRVGAAVVTKYVAAYETKYQNPDGSEVDEKEAQKCIANGNCKVVGSVVPTLEPPPPPSTTSTASTQAAAFFESKSSAVPTTTSVPPPPPPPPVSTESAKSESKSSGSSGGKGLDVDFPEKTVLCSTFPSDYGAVPASWLGIEGWTTIQQGIGKYLDLGGLVPKYSQANNGGCQEDDICSYACPPGYDKTQWPEENQGAEGQSIGGLRCKNGYLTLTRPKKSKKLCAPGVGRVKVVSKLKKVVSICKTDYPGNERMSVPYEIQPGGEAALYNPRASDTYVWKGSKTTSQYYVNPESLTKEKACIWGEKGDNFGNFSPTNLGVGTNENDETFIGLFANKPSTTATLEFDIHIVVDGSTKCTLKSGVYSGPNEGCTAGVRNGQEATIYLLNSGDSP